MVVEVPAPGDPGAGEDQRCPRLDDVEGPVLAVVAAFVGEVVARVWTTARSGLRVGSANSERIRSAAYG